MVGTLPPIYESLPDLSLLFVANNPGTSVLPQCPFDLLHSLSLTASANGKHLGTLMHLVHNTFLLSSLHCMVQYTVIVCTESLTCGAFADAFMCM